MNKIIKNTYMHFIIFGIALILISFIIQIPGGALTTLESLNGDSTDYYVFDNKYSSIDEYVGGDAYNYIIGASLVAGKMAGTITAKVILIVGGIICLCFGLTFLMQSKKEQENISLTHTEDFTFQENETSCLIDKSSYDKENIVVVDVCETDKTADMPNENH